MNANASLSNPRRNWIHRRRPLLTALIVLVAVLFAVVSGAPPADLLRPSDSWRFWLPWGLILFGIFVRVWGSGNLRKNEEITNRGIYTVVRHPLYLGSLSLFLAFFLTIGDPLTGLAFFGILLAGVYYPTMLSEEAYLARVFPSQIQTYRPPPRLVPDLTRWREAVQTDRFARDAAHRNLGFRSVWFILFLPIFLRLLSVV